MPAARREVAGGLGPPNHLHRDPERVANPPHQPLNELNCPMWLTVLIEVHGGEGREHPEVESVDRALLAHELLEHGLLQLQRATRGGGQKGFGPSCERRGGEEGGKKESKHSTPVTRATRPIRRSEPLPGSYHRAMPGQGGSARRGLRRDDSR
jgi:hypothetical protein